MITTPQIVQAEMHPVRSRTHTWLPGEKAEYDSLRAAGRRLYDNLRTQFDASHAEAFTVALDTHGKRPVL